MEGRVELVWKQKIIITLNLVEARTRATPGLTHPSVVGQQLKRGKMKTPTKDQKSSLY